VNGGRQSRPPLLLVACPMNRRFALVTAVVLSLGAPSCARWHGRSEIRRDAAIRIARGQASFSPTKIEAKKATSNGRPVWRVTIRGRLPGQPAGLFEMRIVDVDRHTGAILSVARS
jgi:hypothetical protein